MIKIQKILFPPECLLGLTPDKEQEKLWVPEWAWRKTVTKPGRTSIGEKAKVLERQILRNFLRITLIATTMTTCTLRTL